MARKRGRRGEDGSFTALEYACVIPESGGTVYGVGLLRHTRGEPEKISSKSEDTVVIDNGLSQLTGDDHGRLFRISPGVRRQVPDILRFNVIHVCC